MSQYQPSHSKITTQITAVITQDGFTFRQEPKDLIDHLEHTIKNPYWSKMSELPDYETLFPKEEETPIKTTPRRSQRIKSTGTPAKIKSLIRTAQENQVEYHLDISTRFHFEIVKLLAILPLSRTNQRILIIPYQPTELQLVKAYKILPIDLNIIATPCPSSKSKTLENPRHPRSQFLLRLLEQDYPRSQGTSGSLGTPETRPATTRPTRSDRQE